MFCLAKSEGRRPALTDPHDEPMSPEPRSLALLMIQQVTGSQPSKKHRHGMQPREAPAPSARPTPSSLHVFRGHPRSASDVDVLRCG